VRIFIQSYYLNSEIAKNFNAEPAKFFPEGMPSARKARQARSQRNLIAFDLTVSEHRLTNSISEIEDLFAILREKIEIIKTGSTL